MLNFLLKWKLCAIFCLKIVSKQDVLCGHSILFQFHSALFSLFLRFLDLCHGERACRGRGCNGNFYWKVIKISTGPFVHFVTSWKNVTNIVGRIVTFHALMRLYSYYYFLLYLFKLWLWNFINCIKVKIAKFSAFISLKYTSLQPCTHTCVPYLGILLHIRWKIENFDQWWLHWRAKYLS